jgi:hypothetical protein
MITSIMLFVLATAAPQTHTLWTNEYNTKGWIARVENIQTAEDCYSVIDNSRRVIEDNTIAGEKSGRYAQKNTWASTSESRLDLYAKRKYTEGNALEYAFSWKCLPTGADPNYY